MSGLLLLLLSPLVASHTNPLIASYKASLRTNKQPINPTLGLTKSIGINADVLTGSNDIVQQTRSQAESLKEDLRAMASNPRAAQILNRIFADKNNVCIKSMDDAIEAIETSTALFENAGTEIKQLVEIIQVFQGLTDTPTAVRETAKIFRLLDVLIPKISPDTSSTCRSTSADVFGSLSSLGVLVTELSSRDDIYFSTQKRQSLRNSANIVNKVTNFLTKLKKSFSKFDRICTNNKDYNVEVITAMGDMMTDLADLYRAVGGSAAAEEISEQGDFTKQVVANIKKLGDFDLISLDCNTPGSSKLIANAMDDLAAIIEDVGMENLCNQLDLDCTLL